MNEMNEQDKDQQPVVADAAAGVADATAAATADAAADQAAATEDSETGAAPADASATATDAAAPAPATSSNFLSGVVVSDGMDKTATVLVERKVKHPVYQKYIRRSKKFMIHDEENVCRNGYVVAIAPCRPLSKRKSWRLQSVLRRPE